MSVNSATSTDSSSSSSSSSTSSSSQGSEPESVSSNTPDAKLVCRSKKRQCTSSFDRITALPNNIVDTILMHLPLQETVRTSVLSRKWRYQWVTVPQLVFEENDKKFKSCDKKDKYNVDIVYQILLQHEGPLRKFSLGDTTCLYNGRKLEKVISLLSRKGIQDMTLRTSAPECSDLNSSIFSCVELKQLCLDSCVFYPLSLVGFDKLVTIELLSIEVDLNISIPCGPMLESLKLITIPSEVGCFSVDAPNLKSLIYEGCVFCECEISCPSLKLLSLNESGESSLEVEFDMFQLLQALPLLENLQLSYEFLKLLDDVGLEHELEFELSPLKKLREIEVTLADSIEYSEFPFEFFEFLLAISPQLKTLSIKYYDSYADWDCDRVLLELQRLRRASPDAQIAFLRL